MILLLFEAAVVALAVLLLVPVATLLVQVCASLRKPAAQPGVPTSAGRVAVLIPAHDEAVGISRTLESLRSQLAAGDRVIVVADNCSDATATVAAHAGAEVVERQDSVRRGKGYALDHGVRYLEREAPGREPAVVVIVDADCVVHPGALRRIADLSLATGRTVQARYDMHAPAPRSSMSAIAEFAWLVRNQVRAQGMLRLGLPCHLMGSGMAFPWQAIRTLPLASGHIVEDMLMGVQLARAGAPALYCPEARVHSEFPANREGSRSQRRRWEHGHLSMMGTHAPRLLWQGLRERRADLISISLDILVPPLALLTLVVACCTLAALLLYAAGSSPWAPVLAMLDALMLAGAVLLAWRHHGREVLGFNTLLLAAGYAVRKLPLYLAFLVRRQVAWVRSKRDEP